MRSQKPVYPVLVTQPRGYVHTSTGTVLVWFDDCIRKCGETKLYQWRPEDML